MNDPVPNNSFAPLAPASVPPASDTPPAPSTAPSTAPSPVDPGVDGAEAQIGLLVQAFTEYVDSTKSHIASLCADFETSLAQGHQEIAAITNELKKGGLVQRLDSLELAVASHAAPMIMQAGHDGLDLLHTWFAGIKDRFDRMVAALALDKAAAAEEAKKAAQSGQAG